MRGYPLASVISVDDVGFPFVSLLPLHVHERAGAFSLSGHLARANPQVDFLRARPKVLISFMGPHAFMSTRVYADLARVPTWSYLTVQCTVQAREVPLPSDKDLLLKQLIGDHDPAYATQWRNLPENFQQGMMNGIVAFEFDVLTWSCKLKLNQHRPESHAAMHAAYAAGNDNERALAQWMQRLGLVSSAP